MILFKLINRLNYSILYLKFYILSFFICKELENKNIDRIKLIK